MAKSKKTQFTLSDEERERRMNHPQTPRKHAWRAHIILELGAGCGLSETMRRTGMSKPTVWRWWDRFLAEGVDGLLHDATRPPGRAPVAEDRAKALIALAMSPPPPHASHWTLRALAERMGMVFSTVHNILHKHGLEPHRVKAFKVSRDAAFEATIRDVVGLYVNPPDHAVILSVDEKDPDPGAFAYTEALADGVGPSETRSHDYKRNGITCLMATLDVATGRVVGQMTSRHRSEEFIAFLDHAAKSIEPDTKVHVILDNVSSHKSAQVHEWQKHHPDWSFHFTPTSASWTNAVEGFFSKLSRRRLKNAIFNSLDECIDAIETFIDHHNANEARAFRWSKKPEDIIASWKRGYQMIESNHQGKAPFHGARYVGEIRHFSCWGRVGMVAERFVVGASLATSWSRRCGFLEPGRKRARVEPVFGREIEGGQ